MPQSDPLALGLIMQILGSLNPTSIIELGVGLGKYGFMIRENLEVSQGRLERADWRIKLHGIEVCTRYRNPIHDWAYENMHWDDLRTILAKATDCYDVLLAVDVIEHLEKADGLRMLEWAIKNARYSLISTPRYFWRQEALFDNPYEKHISYWRPSEFPGFHKKIWRVGTQLLVLFTDDVIPPSLSCNTTYAYFAKLLLKTLLPATFLGKHTAKR